MSIWPKDFFRRVLLLAIAAVAVICGFVVISSYRTQINIYEEKELARLSGISHTLSAQINGSAHEQLADKYPQKDGLSHNSDDERYQLLRQVLVDAQQNNELKENIYTLLVDTVTKEVSFGVTTSPNPYWRHNYQEYPEDLLSSFGEYGVLRPYEDENGHWLSAYAPVTNTKGETVALVQVDQQFDVFLMMAREAAWKNILFSFLVVALLSGAMLYVLRNMLINQKKLQDERLSIEQQRRDLSANISHDLRTPLASIHGYVETLLLKKDKLDEERKTQYLKTTLQNTNRLKNLVDQLFELSRLESEEKKLLIEPFNLIELVADMLAGFRFEANKKNIEILPISPNENLPLALGDLEQINRVLQNLLGNAIQHGTEDSKIWVEIDSKKNGLFVRVKDNGPGIEKEKLPLVFERFSSMRNGGKGSGLGLAIVKKILDLHQSKYGIESTKGQGTEFWFSLQKANF